MEALSFKNLVVDLLIRHLSQVKSGTWIPIHKVSVIFIYPAVHRISKSHGLGLLVQRDQHIQLLLYYFIHLFPSL